MGILTGSYLDYIDGTPGGFLVVDNLNLFVSQSTYITEDLYVSGTIYGITTTASYVNPLSQSVLISGSLIVNGPISASILNVSIITSSISSYSGSTIFGSSSLDTHKFTGSILTTGSVYVTGSIYTKGTLFGTSSYSLNALSSSRSITSSYAVTASYALNVVGTNTTGSFTGSFTGSIISSDIRVTDNLSTTQNYITRNSILNNNSGIIWSALNPTIYSAFINYYATDLNYGGTFFQAGTIIISADGISTSILNQNAPSLGSGTLVFVSSFMSSLKLSAAVSGMNTACDFVLDVKTLL